MISHVLSTYLQYSLNKLSNCMYAPLSTATLQAYSFYPCNCFLSTRPPKVLNSFIIFLKSYIFKDFYLSMSFQISQASSSVLQLPNFPYMTPLFAICQKFSPCLYRITQSPNLTPKSSSLPSVKNSFHVFI